MSNSLFVYLGIPNSLDSFRMGLDHDNSQAWNDEGRESERYGTA